MNKVILVGNLTRDPELSETPNGVAVCRFSIAVSRDYANNEGNRETDFFNIDASEDFSLVDEFVEKIEFKDGYGYCNALEAIALALQSKWTTLEGPPRRA